MLDGMTGERVGDWVIDAEVGHDHRGRTFRARAADDPGKVATIKVLSGAHSPELHELFRGRLLVLRKLSHPNPARWYPRVPVTSLSVTKPSRFAVTSSRWDPNDAVKLSSNVRSEITNVRASAATLGIPVGSYWR